MKKNIIFLAVGFTMISLCSFWIIYLRTQKPVKDSYVNKVHALYFTDEEIQNKNIEAQNKKIELQNKKMRESVA